LTWLAGLRAVGAEVREGEIGPDPFQAACRMGLEELVSKHRDRPYRGGRQKFCIKVNDGARTGCAWLCPALADRERGHHAEKREQDRRNDKAALNPIHIMPPTHRISVDNVPDQGCLAISLDNSRRPDSCG
jgi:hypothetical protein